MALFTLYDGFGGNRCSEYLNNNLHVNFSGDSSLVASNPPDYSKALINSFRKTDYEFLQIARMESLSAGSSVMVALLEDNKLVIGHVGNTRALLCRGMEVVHLTSEHTLERPDELQRITNASGNRTLEMVMNEWID